MIKHYQDYLQILKEELVPAMGCTEPIAIAYACATLREVLGEIPLQVSVYCSGNIIKNAKCVTVPNTGSLVGIEASAIIGILAGDPSKKLEVIQHVEPQHIEKTQQLLNTGYCSVKLLESTIPLHIQVRGNSQNHSAMVEIRDTHTNISKIEKDEKIIFENEIQENKYLGVLADRSVLNIKDIFRFSNEVNIEDVKEILDHQIECNMAIAKEGLTGKYGVGIGKMLLQEYPDNAICTKIKAYTASASEARMSGCSLPVMTNSGSGNQGITSSVPVIVFAKEKGLSQEQLYRGLVFSNLVTIHQKTGIGRLSAFCGAVCAGCASSAAITYLSGGTLDQINLTIQNTLADIPGIVCDGAKPSCAIKIASSIDAGLMAHYLAMKNVGYNTTDGILKDSIENTISAVARIGKEGMKTTDHEILEIMLER